MIARGLFTLFEGDGGERLPAGAVFVGAGFVSSSDWGPHNRVGLCSYTRILLMRSGAGGSGLIAIQ